MYIFIDLLLKTQVHLTIYRQKYMDQKDEKEQDKEYIKNVQEHGKDYFKFDPTKAAFKNDEATEEKSGTNRVTVMEQSEDVKAHHLLVLLLRLRQICNHPGNYF